MFYKSPVFQKVNKNLTSLVSLQWAQYLAAFILLPHLISVLGSGLYGDLIIAQAWCAIVIVIVEYGFSITGVAHVGKNKDSPEKLAKLFWAVTLVRLTIASVLLLPLIILVKVGMLADVFGLIFLITATSAVGVALNTQWYFLGKQKVQEIVKWSLLIKLLILLSNFVFVQEERDVYIAATLFSLSYILPAIYSFVSALRRPEITSFQFNLKACKCLFLEATPFLFGRFANIGVNQLTLIVSGFVLSNHMITILAVLMKVMQVGTMVYAPLQQHLLSKMSRKFSYSEFRKFTLICLFIAGVQVVIFYLVAPYLSLFLLKEKNEQFIEIARIVSVMFPIGVLYMMSGAPLMIPLNGNKEFNQGVMIAFFMHVFLLGGVYLASMNGVDISLLIYSVITLPLSKLLSLMIRSIFLLRLKDKEVIN